MSSSIRGGDSHSTAFDRGLVYQGEKVVGGVDLPADAQTFVDEFNRVYAAAGLRVVRMSQVIDNRRGIGEG
ncbi:MAG: hypothetical protein JJ992_12400 [Planctomycetes bacterium]|nr:hypothetical protein [Planctomycetota bacterium]